MADVNKAAQRRLIIWEGFFVKDLVKEFWYEEDGLQTVELVLILVILVGLIAVLRDTATQWLTDATDRVNDWIASVNA